jgi:hypothetical protein
VIFKSDIGLMDFKLSHDLFAKMICSLLSAFLLIDLIIDSGVSYYDAVTKYLAN